MPDRVMQLDPARLAYRPNEVAKMLGLSKSKVFFAIRTGALPAVKRDGVVLIARDALQKYLDDAIPMKASRTG